MDGVAAALARPPPERDQRPERREVAGRVVARLGRHQGGTVDATLADRQAGRALAELLPAGPITPRPDRAVAVHRDVDQARVPTRQLLHPEASSLERTGPVPLHK